MAAGLERIDDDTVEVRIFFLYFLEDHPAEFIRARQLRRERKIQNVVPGFRLLSEVVSEILREDLRGCGHNALFEHLVDFVDSNLRFIFEARPVLKDNVERDHIHIRMGLKVERHVAHTVC